MIPPIVVNAKLYPQVTHPGRLQALVASLAKVARGQVAFSPPMVHLGLLGQTTQLVWVSPHVDPLAPGPGTGHTSAEAARAAGAKGVILNHAEHKVPHEALAKSLAQCKAAGLWTLVCADSLAECVAVAKLGPEAIAVEPPELIGGNVSVTDADPAIVKNAVAAVRTINPAIRVYCGAGIKNGRDVKAAKALGAHGVLVASGVVKAPDPAAALADLLAGWA